MDELEEWLTNAGFKERYGEDLTYTLKGVAVLIFPRANRPWYTFQRLSSSEVQWFQDFSVDSPVSAMIAFMADCVGVHA